MSTPINDGGPAFPVQESIMSGGNPVPAASGMTIHDYFAAQIIGHLVSNSNQNPEWIRNTGREEQARTYAENAYSLSDAMLAARERKSE